jgi:hypothetical protein
MERAGEGFPLRDLGASALLATATLAVLAAAAWAAVLFWGRLSGRI